VVAPSQVLGEHRHHRVVIEPAQPGVMLAPVTSPPCHVWTARQRRAERPSIARLMEVRVVEVSGDANVDLGASASAAPSNPDVVYASVDAPEVHGRHSSEPRRRVTWECNPFDRGAMYFGQMTSIRRTPIVTSSTVPMTSTTRQTPRSGCAQKVDHVPSSLLFVLPNNPNYARGWGWYESYDRAANWRTVPNLPVIAVLRRSPATSRGVLHRLRRHAGQQHASRPGAQSKASTASPRRTGVAPLPRRDAFHCKVDAQILESTTFVYVEVSQIVRRPRPLRTQDRPRTRRRYS